MTKLVVATQNMNKLREIASVLNFEGWTFHTLAELGSRSNPVEDANDFVGNARIKARAAHLDCECAALADDSGLVVDALGGAPGVFSARYSGANATDESNNAKLLLELKDVPTQDRTAHFVCAIVFIDTNGTEYVAQGRVDGRIAFQASGDGGFGYDPLFYPDYYKGKLSMAQLTHQQKNAISHRGCALKKLFQIISNKS